VSTVKHVGIEFLDVPEVDGHGRVTIGRYGGWTVDICPMLFNDRLVLTPESAPGVYDFGWCYPKGAAAYLAALMWDPVAEGEPRGFIKAVHPVPRRPGQVAR
jgi:hypothetical protein